MSHSLEAVLGVYMVIISTYACLVRAQSLLNAAIHYRFVTALRHRLYAALSDTDWLFFSRLRAV